MKGKNNKKKLVVSNVDKDKEKLLFKQQLDFASDIFKKYCGGENIQNNEIETKINDNKKNIIQTNIKIKSNNNNKKGQTQGQFISKNKLNENNIKNNITKQNKSQNNFKQKIPNQINEPTKEEMYINLLIAEHNSNIDQIKNNQLINQIEEEENILNIQGLNNEINMKSRENAWFRPQTPISNIAR